MDKANQMASRSKAQTQNTQIHISSIYMPFKLCSNQRGQHSSQVAHWLWAPRTAAQIPEGEKHFPLSFLSGDLMIADIPEKQ